MRVKSYGKTFLEKYFIHAFTGMAYGLFVTLIAGLILKQFGSWLQIQVLIEIGKLATLLMGAGIGVGIAYYLHAKPLVIFSALVAGFIGAHSGTLLDGNLFNVIAKALPGNPIGAYLTSVFAYKAGELISNKTKLDILLVPMLMLVTAVLVSLLIAPPFITGMDMLSSAIAAATNLHPLLMGVVISVSMGILLTLPTSSAAIAIAINLHGIAGGAAVVGTASHMIGFAVASFKENGIGGFVAQGLGTSMLQIPNVMKNPLIMLPAIIASAIVGPLATSVFFLQCDASGAGMGTSGLVGIFAVIEESATSMSNMQMWTAIILLMFLLPAVIAGVSNYLLRKVNWIKPDDMLLPK